MWRTRLGRAYDWLASRRLVGSDLSGNKYYTEFQSSTSPEKRFAVYKDRHSAPHSTPVEWWSWLHGRRNDPPTLQELTRAENARAALEKKVKALEIEDEKQRLRMVVRGNAGEKKDEPSTGSIDILRLVGGSKGKESRQETEVGKSGNEPKVRNVLLACVWIFVYRGRSWLNLHLMAEYYVL